MLAAGLIGLSSVYLDMHSVDLLMYSLCLLNCNSHSIVMFAFQPEWQVVSKG
jgi:hypothetical protein